MSISMHSASVPVFVRMFGNLSLWLDKAEAYATAKKFDPQVYLAARLAPDMLPFTKQIQIACDAAKFGVPVCPHAGGVGLCEMVQHLAMFDFVAVSGSSDGRWIEYVDHLHEHFTDPVVVTAGRYRAPAGPGIGARMRDASIAEFRFPDGPAWTAPG